MIKDVVTGTLKARCQILEEKAPVMLWYHGIKERGDNLDMVDNYGPLKYVLNPSLGPKIDFNVICQQLPANQSWSLKHVQEGLKWVKENLPNADLSQVWISGASWGGGAVWSAMCDPETAKNFAAFAPMACINNNFNEQDVKDLVSVGVPGWAFHAENDTTVPYSKTADMVKAVNAFAGYEQIRLYTAWGSTQHTIWEKAWIMPEFIPWLKTHRLTIGEEQASVTVSNGQARFKTSSGVYSVPVIKVQ